MRRVLIIVVVGYALLCSCVAVLQRKLTYFPSDAITITPAQYGMAFEDVVLTTDDEHALAAWWLPSRNARGTAILCHGNGGNRANSLAIARALLERDFNVLAFDYRGYGGNDGSPTEDGLCSDVRAAYAWVTTTGGTQPQRVLAYGHSLGAAVAIALASEQEVGAVFIENGFSSLTDIASDLYPWLPVRLLIADSWNSADRLDEVDEFVFVFHGLSDTMIDGEHSRELAERAGTVEMSFQGDHNASVFFDPELQVQVDAILDVHFPREVPR